MIRFQFEINLNGFGGDRLSGGAGFDRVNFETVNLTEINGVPFCLFPLGVEAQAMFVNLASSLVPGFVGTIADADAAALDVFEQLSSPEGSIRDLNGPTANFADIEEFDLTSSTDVSSIRPVSHIIDGGDGNDFMNGGGGADGA